MKIYGVVGFDMNSNGSKALTKQLVIGCDTETKGFWGEAILDHSDQAQKVADLFNKAELSSRQDPPL